jgi:type I restriction enzyme, R subunit
VPFLYATNGEVLWFHDVRHPLNRSRRVSAFHTPAALTEMLMRNAEAEFAHLAALPLHERIRPYQHEANAAIEDAIRQRRGTRLRALALAPT